MTSLKSNHLLNQAIVNQIVLYNMNINMETGGSLATTDSHQYKIIQAFNVLREEILIYSTYSTTDKRYKNKTILNNVHFYLYLSQLNQSPINYQLQEFYKWFDKLEHNDNIPLDHYVETVFIPKLDEVPVVGYLSLFNKIMTNMIRSWTKSNKSELQKDTDSKPIPISYATMVTTLPSRSNIIFLLNEWKSSYQVPEHFENVIETRMFKQRDTNYLLEKDEKIVHNNILIIDAHMSSLNAIHDGYHAILDRDNLYVDEVTSVMLAILDNNEFITLTALNEFDNFAEENNVILGEYSTVNYSPSKIMSAYICSLNHITWDKKVKITLPYVKDNQWVYYIKHI